VRKLAERQRRIDRFHFSANGSLERPGRHRFRADDEGHFIVRVLFHGRVNLRTRLYLQPVAPHITRDADDGKPGMLFFIGSRHFESLADRIGTGKESARDGFIDDADVRLVRSVVIGKVTAAPQ
jgi:hypothetical protein